MSAPNLQLWVGHHVLALRNAIYYPAVILEVSNESKCVMVEFKSFHGLATMYQDVFNRGHLSIISDVCPKYSEVKVNLQVAIKSWSYETNQLFYTPGFVVAVLDDCGRFLVRDFYDMERLVGIDDMRVILPFWWKYAYYHSQAQAFSKQNYIDQNMLPQPPLMPPPPPPQAQPQSKRKSQSRAQIQPQAKRKSQPQVEIQQQPEQGLQPQVQFQPKFTPPPPQPTLNQLLQQPQPMLPPFSNIFHQPYYAWDQVLPRLPPPYPGEIYQPMNQYINNQVNVEKENVVNQSTYREIIPKPNDYNNYNYNQNEAYPELLNIKNEHSSVINYNNNQVNDIEKKNEVNLSLNDHFSTNNTGSYSVKAKTIQVPVITKELEVPSGVKVPQVPVKSKVPELLPITTQGQSLPATSKAQVIPTTSKLVELPAEVKSILNHNSQLQENVVTQSKYREIIPKPVTEPLVPNLQATTKPQPKKRSYAKRKKAEDENTMRRPMNAFMYFAQEHRNALLLQNSQGFDNRHISKILAENWYQLPPAEKLKYTELAAKAKEELAKADPKGLSWKRKNNKIRIQCEVSQIEAKVSSSDEPRLVMSRINEESDDNLRQVNQIEAKASSSDDEPRLVIDESRINEESDDNMSPLFVPKTSDTSQLKKLLRGNSQLPEIEEPKNSNKEIILESNLVPTLPPELDSCLPESLYDTTVENFKNVIKSEFCTSSISYNGGSMEQKEEKLLGKEKTLIGETFFPPDFSVEAVEKTETSEMNALTEAVIKEILISDAFYNNNGHYTKPQRKRLVVLNMFKENGYYPSDGCIEEVMQKHKDIFGNKNGLKTKIREVRQKLLSKIKNGTAPISPMLKDMIASMIPDGDSPLVTPGTN